MKKLFRFAAALIFTALLFAGFSSPVFGTGSAAERLNLQEGTIGNGVSLRGVSLTDALPEEARAEIYTPMEALMDCEVRIVSDKNSSHVWGTTVPELGIRWDKSTIENTLNAAVVPHARLIERYKFAADRRANPVNLDYGIEIDEAAILKTFRETLAPWNTEPVNADFTARVGSVTDWSQIGSSRQVIVTPGANGYSYDFTDCVHQFVENIKAVNIDDVDGDLIVLKPDVMEIEPAITTERAESMSVIGYCTTEYATPGNDEIKQNRENNLIVGIQNLDGNIFDVGTRISVLELYGNVMDPENGYKKAGTYSRAGHELEMGGGLCQVTTTLYNAILEAELNVYYRHQHSYMISYVEPGLDAMVYPQGGADFIFDNDSSDIIKIEGAVDLHDQWIHIWILGHEDHAPGHRVEYESVVEGYNKANVT
ncbi:MAG: VanW family protein, partial [Lachnospiraceae bacterium]|nr:VanW family protein [Lachnospiraceae bacterium]